jgi:hypothetical protein
MTKHICSCLKPPPLASLFFDSPLYVSRLIICDISQPNPSGKFLPGSIQIPLPVSPNPVDFNNDLLGCFSDHLIKVDTASALKASFLGTFIIRRTNET